MPSIAPHERYSPIDQMMHSLRRSAQVFASFASRPACADGTERFGFAPNRSLAVERSRTRQRVAVGSWHGKCEPMPAASRIDQMLAGIATANDEGKQARVRQQETSPMNLLPSMRGPPPRTA
jgi:hypothetical protein